jgi:hypothetical protein
MKTSKILSVMLCFSLAFLITFPLDLFAHANTDFRSGRCRTWRKTYRASTDVISFPYIPLCVSTRSSCGGVMPWGAATCDKSCGYSEAYIYPFINNPQNKSDCVFHELAVNFNNGVPCWAGFSEPTNLYEDIYLNTSYKIAGNEKQILSMAEWNGSKHIDTYNRTFTLKNVNGRIFMHKQHNQNIKLELSLWKSKDDSMNEIMDTIMTAEKIFQQEFIKIEAGQVIVSQGFQDFMGENILIEDDGDFVVVTIKNLNYTCEIPEEVDINEELVITTGTYSEPEEAKMLEKELEKISSNILVYPNPVKNNLKIKFNDIKKLNEPTIKIRIFNTEGMETKSFEFKGVREEELQLDIQELSTGIYYISIQFNEEYSIQKIIVQ